MQSSCCTIQLACSQHQTCLLPAQTPLNLPTSALLTSSQHKEAQKKNQAFTNLYTAAIHVRQSLKFSVQSPWFPHTLGDFLAHKSIKNSSHRKSPGEWIHCAFSILLPTNKSDLFPHHAFYSNYSWNTLGNCLKITLDFWVLFFKTLKSFPTSLISYWFCFIIYHFQTWLSFWPHKVL